MTIANTKQVRKKQSIQASSTSVYGGCTGAFGTGDVVLKMYCWVEFSALLASPNIPSSPHAFTTLFQEHKEGHERLPNRQAQHNDQDALLRLQLRLQESFQSIRKVHREIADIAHCVLERSQD